MNQGMYPLAASMVNQINRLDQISNNLANVNTYGFKQEGTTETTFNYYLHKMEQSRQVMLKEGVVMNNIPKIDSRYTNAEMGPIVMTGNALDFALNKPDTFFKIQNENGDIVYTRDGAFKNLDGFLVDSNGNNVLSMDNAVIEVVDNFELQIGVARTPYTNLEKIGDNTYLVKDMAEVVEFGNNDNMILRGAVEQSNVNSVTAMVELIDAHRRLDQSQRAIRTIDELNSKLIDQVGGNTK